jgi:hypothetical protein
MVFQMTVSETYCNNFTRTPPGENGRSSQARRRRSAAPPIEPTLVLHDNTTQDIACGDSATVSSTSNSAAPRRRSLASASLTFRGTATEPGHGVPPRHDGALLPGPPRPDAEPRQGAAGELDVEVRHLHRRAAVEAPACGDAPRGEVEFRVQRGPPQVRLQVEAGHGVHRRVVQRLLDLVLPGPVDPVQRGGHSKGVANADE